MRAKEFIVEADSYSPPTLNVGDRILKGKFKNSPAEIKGFTQDKHNQPVLKTDRGDVQLFKPRVAKLMGQAMSEGNANTTFGPMYHGSNAVFNKFDKTKIGSNFGFDWEGIFFTSDISIAKTYGSNIITANLRITNPFTLDDAAEYLPASYDEEVEENDYTLTQYYDIYSRKIIDLAKKLNKDGVFFEDFGLQLAVVFDPQQIEVLAQGKQGMSEGSESGYKEIEFVCANPEFSDATDPDLQKQMYAGLKQIPGVIPLFQDQSDYSEGQYSLTAIYKDRAVRGQILKLAKQLDVRVDLEQPVTDDYVDRAIRGEHEGQQAVAENFADKHRQPLDFDKIYGKYLKVTDNNGNPNKTGFSLVTPLNGASWHWHERPEFKQLVKQKLNNPEFLGDHKYQQIIDAMAGNKFDPARHLYKENFADGRGPGRPGDSQRHGIPKGATLAQLERASHAKGRKGQLAHWQLNMRRGKKNESK